MLGLMEGCRTSPRQRRCRADPLRVWSSEIGRRNMQRRHRDMRVSSWGSSSRLMSRLASISAPRSASRSFPRSSLGPWRSQSVLSSCIRIQWDVRKAAHILQRFRRYSRCVKNVSRSWLRCWWKCCVVYVQSQAPVLHQAARLHGRSRGNPVKLGHVMFQYPSFHFQ